MRKEPLPLSKPLTDIQAADLLAQSQAACSVQEREHVLHVLLSRYEALPDKDTNEAQALRHVFLFTLEDHPTILEQEAFARFLTEHVREDDFAAMLWEAPHAVAALSEIFYGFRFSEDTMATKITAHVHALLCHALHHFEQRGDHEHMFRLLQIAPISPVMSSPELHRLRNRAYRYEIQRVRRRRRFLYGYLLLQVILIGLVFPLLFIYAENGVVQRKIEEVTNVDLPREVRRQYLSYADGLYWSLITAGSIGYGDITPVTRIGKVIAATLGIMGVITIGVTTGLILNWITPRRLDWH